MEVIKRAIIPLMLKRLRSRKVVVLTGARQTGKTTLVRDILPPHLSAAPTYLNLDDPDERLTIAADPVRRLARTGSLTVVDEVQKLPGILDAVKVLVDRPDDHRFLLLGSSQILLLRQVRESLAGRAAFLDLWPLSAAERQSRPAAQTNGLDLIWDQVESAMDALARATADPEHGRLRRAHAETGLLWGGYPALLGMPDDAERQAWLRDYRRSYLERDLPDLGRVAEPDLFAKAITLIAVRTGQILSVSALARDLGVAVNTARRYVHFLEISYQARLVSPYLPNLGKRVVKSPKAYWTDSGLARVLGGRPAASDGALYETWVLGELLRWRSSREDPPDIFFYRTHAGLEVDFVVRGPSGPLLAIECRASEHAARTDARAVDRFLQELERSDPGPRLGLVVYAGREVERLTSRVWAVPGWLLFGTHAIS